jgi:hypothetical protein
MIAAFLDPMTHQPFSDPVVAEDGHTYSRQSILDWFATCEQRRVPITSPLTAKSMGKTLRENLDMKTALDEYLQQRRSGKFRTESDAPASDVSTQMKALAIGDAPATSASDSPEKENGPEDMSRSQKTSYKTALCRFFEQSRCERGSNCAIRAAYPAFRCSRCARSHARERVALSMARGLGRPIGAGSRDIVHPPALMPHRTHGRRGASPSVASNGRVTQAHTPTGWRSSRTCGTPRPVAGVS